MRIWYYDVLNDQGEVIDHLDPHDSCNPYEPNARCGGCGECMLIQARHMKLRAVGYPTIWDRLNDANWQYPD